MTVEEFDEVAGDLHLVPEANPAIDQVTRIGDAIDDFDANLRPEAVGATDLGAAELGAGAAIFDDGFESGDTSAWDSAL